MRLLQIAASTTQHWAYLFTEETGTL
jgi:hypothetical protein